MCENNHLVFADVSIDTDGSGNPTISLDCGQGSDSFSLCDGAAHLLWTQTNTDARLRDRFFLEVADGTCQNCELHIGLYTKESRLLLADGADAVTIPLPPSEAGSTPQ